jgi:diguanylate cyclase (GGDEF)-like protein
LVVVLIPLSVAVGLATKTVLNQSSIRSQAVGQSRSSLDLDVLLKARVAIYSEFVPSLSILQAESYHLSIAQLNALLNENVRASLALARRAVDQDPVFKPRGVLASYYPRIVTERRTIDQGKASPNEAQAFFEQLGSTIDQQWQTTFNGLSRANSLSSTSTTSARLAALERTFTAFTSTITEENDVETVLRTPATSEEVQSMIVSHQQFESSALGFPKGLGPRGTAAWNAVAGSHSSKIYSVAVELALAVALGHEAPPFAIDVTELSGIAKAEVTWVNELTTVVLASSHDLRIATNNEANSASRSLNLTFLFMLLLVLLTITAVLTLGRSIRRPLTRIVSIARSVQEGEFELPEMDAGGPTELSMAAGALNEMTSTLRVVQAQAVALAGGYLQDPILENPLPGRTGAALQSALSELQLSIRANEVKRQALHEQATHDPLTGLLNRGAALAALELDLARVGREQGELVLAVLFIDLDDFKKINDSLGHHAGDAALQTVADVLRATTRASDVVARFGGDEFIVGCLGKRNSGVPELLANRICDNVANSDVEGTGVDGPRRSLQLMCSIGVAVSEQRDSTAEMLIDRADHALYSAKTHGRGEVRLAGPGDDPRSGADAGAATEVESTGDLRRVSPVHSV